MSLGKENVVARFYFGRDGAQIRLVANRHIFQLLPFAMAHTFAIDGKMKRAICILLGKRAKYFTVFCPYIELVYIYFAFYWISF